TALKLTTARYYTPSGRSIQAEGIIPDIELQSLKVSSIERSIEPLKEADLTGHLENGSKKAAPSGSKAEGGTDGEEEDSLIDDYQLYEALNMLKGMAILQSRMQ
ncbi:MAG: S41 family peptidase, partial [Gammaproteobacteria bacterium]